MEIALIIWVVLLAGACIYLDFQIRGIRRQRARQQQTNLRFDRSTDALWKEYHRMEDRLCNVEHGQTYPRREQQEYFIVNRNGGPDQRYLTLGEDMNAIADQFGPDVIFYQADVPYNFYTVKPSYHKAAYRPKTLPWQQDPKENDE